MAVPQRQVVEAVRAAIVASAHMAAFEGVAAAAVACKRLGGLTSGRWRSAARDLEALQADLETALERSAESLSSLAQAAGLPEEALWTAGDAAAAYDMLREFAIEQLDEEDGRAARILRGEVVYGVAFIDEADVPDRGTTLIFGWSDPLAPATWGWEANWVANGDDADELDLYEAAELEEDDGIVEAVAAELGCARDDAREALSEVALALTRAQLLMGSGAEDEENEEEEFEDRDEDNGAH
jgi:hypothetical protein